MKASALGTDFSRTPAPICHSLSKDLLLEENQERCFGTAVPVSCDLLGTWAHNPKLRFRSGHDGKEDQLCSKQQQNKK